MISFYNYTPRDLQRSVILKSHSVAAHLLGRAEYSVEEPVQKANMKSAVVLAVFLTVSCSDAFGINTVSSLNVTQYLGRWYQVV